MLGKDLSRALGDLPLEMVEEASACGNRKSGRKMWMRVAALAATIAIVLTVSFWPSKDGLVTAPGVLKVYAYDYDSGTNINEMLRYELTEEVNFTTKRWYQNNWMYGLPLTLNVVDPEYDGMEIKMDVRMTHGGFYGDRLSPKYEGKKLSELYFGNEFTVDNGESVFWTYKDVAAAAPEGMRIDEIFERVCPISVTIIIRADEYIVGYAVIEIRHVEDFEFTATVMEIVKFPKVDGVFQTVTEEDVFALVG